jgi:hypothetical protein
VRASNLISPQGDLVPGKGWHHDDPAETWSHYDEFRAVWYDVPPLTAERKRAIAEAAGVQFRGPDTDEAICPGEKYHLYPTSAGACKIVDYEGVPWLTCSNRGCEGGCAAKNAWMRDIRYEEIRAARSTPLYKEPSTALLVAMGYDGPDVSLTDFVEGTEGRGHCVGTVLLKWKALKQKIRRLIDRAAQESKSHRRSRRINKVQNDR